MELDRLEIQLNAKAESANAEIDRLITKLDKLSTSLGRLNVSGINGVSNGIDKLGRSMQAINSINSKSFTKLADNIQKLGNINVYNLNSSASALSNVTTSFNQLGGVTQSAQHVTTLANSLSKLGNKTVVNATQNIPQLANSLSYLMQVLSKAPIVSQNVISLVNSLATLTSQGAKVGSTSNSVVRGLNNISNSSKKAKSSVFSLASAFGSLYANFFWVIRGIKGVWASIGETTDYIESFNYYTVAFDKIASEWDDKYESYGTENAKKYTNAFITEMSDSLSKLSGLKLDLSDDLESGILSDTGMKNLGLNLQEVTQYASQLASVTNSVGQTGEVTLMAADAFTKLAGDMSSLFNVDYSDVAKNLQSGLIGQSRALYKYGIDITNATLQTYAYEAGIDKAVSEMTQMEKMQLRMIAILDQSKVAWGDLADTIETPANMLRQLSNNFKEASMVLGQLFLPLLNKVLPAINGVVIAVKNLMVSMASFIGVDIDLDSLGSGATEVTDDVLDMQESLDDATDSAKKLKNQLQGFDKLNNITTSNASNVNGAIGGTIDLSQQIKDATEKYQAAWNEAYANMENKAHEFAKNIGKALEPIKKLFEDIAIGDYFAVGQDVSKLVVGITDFFTNAISGVDWNKIGESIGEFISGIDFDAILSGVANLIDKAIDASIEQWQGAFNVAPFETAIISAFAIAKFTGLGSAISGALSASLGITGSSFTIPIVLSVASLVFENKVFEEKEELEQKIEEFGEEEGRKQAGTGFFDKQALYRHDVEKTNQAIQMSYLETWGEIDKFFTEWGNKVETHKDATQAANDAINQAYADTLTDIGTGFFTWWEEDVAPWFTEEKWKTLGDNMKTGLETKFNEFKDWWKTTGINDWYENNVKPWFTKEKWQSLANGIKTGVQDKWEEVETWWGKNSKLSEIKTSVESFVTKIKEAWNKAVEWWKNSKSNLSEIKLGIKIPTISIKYDAKDSMASLWKALGFDGTPKFSVSFKQYENGGFPEDGWFRASKGEYFGSFDDGTSVIANNNQIISGISNGVKSANAEQNALLREQNALLRQILAKDTGISTRDVFNAVRSENQDYINMTGRSAFAY